MPDSCQVQNRHQVSKHDASVILDDTPLHVKHFVEVSNFNS